MLARTVNHDPILRQKMLDAFGSDPLLRAGSIFGPELQIFIRNAWLAGSHNPA
jgi:hypothetical protein